MEKILRNIGVSMGHKFNAFHGVTVIIPTNRSQCMEAIIDQSITKYNGLLFRFAIYDSSEGSAIREYVKRYNDLHRETPISYTHCSPEMGGDEKAIKAIKEVTSEYFWLYGDGNLTDFDLLEKVLLREKYNTYDVLDMESANRRGVLNQDKKKELDIIYHYDDAHEYAVRYFSHLTYWGASIIRSSFFQQIFVTDRIYAYEAHEIPWWLACSIFDLIADAKQHKKIIHLGVLYSDSLRYNQEKKDHGWTQDERYYKITFSKLIEGITMMSAWYPVNIKYKMIKNLWNDALVSTRYLFHLRRIGNLTPYMVKKYRKEIMYVPSVYLRMKMISSIPLGLIHILYLIKEINK